MKLGIFCFYFEGLPIAGSLDLQSNHITILPMACLTTTAPPGSFITFFMDVDVDVKYTFEKYFIYFSCLIYYENLINIKYLIIEEK